VSLKRLKQTTEHPGTPITTTQLPVRVNQAVAALYRNGVNQEESQLEVQEH
jgi:hypothetical protein